MAIVNRIAGYASEMTEWRRHLHTIPELGRECHKTAAFVEEKLREFGVDEIQTGFATTGIVAIINGQGAGPTIGLRADMDGLPIIEATDLDYKSSHEGRMHVVTMVTQQCCWGLQSTFAKRGILRAVLR
jgi:hippurate hydrolase